MSLDTKSPLGEVDNGPIWDKFRDEWAGAFHLLHIDTFGVESMFDTPEARSQLNYLADVMRERGAVGIKGHDDGEVVDWDHQYLNPHGPGAIRRYNILDLMNQGELEGGSDDPRLPF